MSSDTTAELPAAPKAKLADLPIDPEEDANNEQIQEDWTTHDDGSSSTPLPPALFSEEGTELTTFNDGSGNMILMGSNMHGEMDMNTSEMYERNQELYNDSILDRPLIDKIVPISELRDEYKNERFIEQINWLEEHGFSLFRRTKGMCDGDCFYRSFGFAFIERLLRDSDVKGAVERALAVLDRTQPMFDTLGFDKIAYEDSYNTIKELIEGVNNGQDGLSSTEEELLRSFQTDYISHTIVYYLRLVTGAQIQLAADDYAPFLTDQDIPNSEDMIEPKTFCEKYVMPLGKEADDVQISALCRAFQVNLDIAYVDGRISNEKVRFVPIRDDIDKNADPIALLYRPGHYDILVGKYQES